MGRRLVELASSVLPRLQGRYAKLAGARVIRKVTNTSEDGEWVHPLVFQLGVEIAGQVVSVVQ
jgi:hypothetical protein